MGRRALQARLPSRQRGGQEALLRLGHEEYQQPQRPHTEEELPGGPGLFPEVHPAQRRKGASQASHLR